MARGASNDIINGSLVFRLDGRNTDSNAYLTDAVNGTICNILNTGYTKTDNNVVIPITKQLKKIKKVLQIERLGSLLKIFLTTITVDASIIALLKLISIIN